MDQRKFNDALIELRLSAIHALPGVLNVIENTVQRHRAALDGRDDVTQGDTVTPGANLGRLGNSATYLSEIINLTAHIAIDDGPKSMMDIPRLGALVSELRPEKIGSIEKWADMHEEAVRVLCPPEREATSAANTVNLRENLVTQVLRVFGLGR